MPLKLPDNLPAIEILKNEHIFVMNDLRASMQDIRPLKILILNLMPLKITTETDLIRLLSNSPLQVEIEFLALSSHSPKNTPIEHLIQFYIKFSKIKNSFYDGMIITGAPVELLPFSEVKYWDELTRIFDWARTHVTSTFYICWAAQAAMHHFYGIEKYPLEKKLFGVFRHTINDPAYPLFRGFDDEFYAPHSRHTTVNADEIRQCPDLKILSESDEAGVYIVSSRGGREFYVTGHSEYSPLTLHNEYVRDLKKGLTSVELPKNYYRNDDPQQPPLVRWRSHANLLYINWLNYFVYQATPFNLSEIQQLGDL
ncbi:MAG TPA: homoserine O-succinyltransferase [Dysgonamonadaceae bacterium]|jgi:homoserine O-succinyltransferase|uniref:homoserine O-acetyltransferase MetA n=1 Tax=Seramator thermalis TaxID=2496270 RepID=UPI00101B6AC4|nr:homoserine O-succinyltransferase [Seramator thermalis]MBP9031095.1 homoserine O-succinyltransferase [Dysgonamonadaceae bacterium]HOM62967.1 homoserine O-succinyltransferase [Dysgonamonadaceae bacterium]HOV34972.1 homoserine O-succinyltransferase [Dysgonamonadaceae bacterium]HPD43938.1 homoserine O-succinyltransferase [Dysgonamonadaceae bacterium]HRS40413.1 homoserine O-succinyltransferase [Dysgonamonadaceae bacterium]